MSTATRSSRSLSGAKKSPLILVFRNADKHHQGVQVLVRPGITFEQLLQQLTTVVGLPTGAVRKLYTADGKSVKTLDDVLDGHNYIAAGPEKVNLESASESLKELEKSKSVKEEGESKEDAHDGKSEEAEDAKAASATPKKSVVSAYGGKPLEKFGTQGEKAKTIYAYRNADKHHAGVKVAVHPRKFKNFDQLREHLSKEVKLPTGPVLKVLTVDGKSIKDLEALEDEGSYICCGAEKFSKERNVRAIPKKLTEKEKPAPVETSAPITPKKVPVVSAYASKSVEKFGTQASKAKVIRAYRNGDKHDQGKEITVNAKFKTLDQLYVHLSKEVGVVTGAVRHIYTFDGKVIKSIEDFEDGGHYVCTGAEKLKTETLPSIKRKSQLPDEPAAENGEEASGHALE
ncbi:hypothetical protein PROFUN_02782 [Planoprotostelium fungivorum]|uniref:Doublecortin domain-containing protein n=1 Tax=Planoprotostelium fungivorum TaxID=1890364 RepID=A0A2P6NXM1_9EUKA|nr:hypothetical protein PROFUN_02782 [Planoprotostelium fungivorum]